jgi:hypothetical protein
MPARARFLTTVVSTVLAFFMVFVLSSSALASATPVAATASAQSSWAYGFVKSVSIGPRLTADGYEYQGSAVLGYAVIINETNTSVSTFELSIHRTIGIAISIEFCKPDCAGPVYFANLSDRAWESTYAWANFTTLGTVYESSAPHLAIGLINSSSSDTANLTESTHSLLPVLSGASAVARSSYLTAMTSSLTTVRFTPALGLFPLDLVPRSNWNSSSSFVAHGSARYAYYYSFHGPKETVIAGPLAGYYSVSPSGNVTLVGSYEPSSIISFGGVAFPAITLSISGPFFANEGVILVPEPASLFGPSSQPWTADENASTSVQMETLDVKPYVDGHFGLEASSWMASSSSANPAESVDAVSQGSSLIPATTNSNPVASVPIQGEPESPGQAVSNSQCLTTGFGCPSSSLPRAFVGVVLLGVVVVAVGALIATVLIADRRQLPPPVYPNASLYPPGAAGPAPPRPKARPGAPPEPPTPEDPLDHLW